MRFVPVLLLLALAGGLACAADRPREVTALKKRLRAELLDQLRDPQSARIRGEFLSTPEDQASSVRSLCGEINARNSYGGYVGFARFVITTDGMVVFEASEPPGAFVGIWPVWCARPIK